MCIIIIYGKNSQLKRNLPVGDCGIDFMQNYVLIMGVFVRFFLCDIVYVIGYLYGKKCIKI